METPKKNIFPSGACMAKYHAYNKKLPQKKEQNDFAAWASGSKGLHHLSGREFLNIPSDKVLLLDVRPDYELSRLFDIENILYCPYKEIESHMDDLPKEKLIVVADATGLRSRETATRLMEAGFKNISNLAGGMVDWDRNGLPVTNDRSRILSGQCMCQLKTRTKSKPGNHSE
jgi:rhodanese-related sulfurtransferase